LLESKTPFEYLYAGVISPEDAFFPAGATDRKPVIIGLDGESVPRKAKPLRGF